jgi:hypothetical protein
MKSSTTGKSNLSKEKMEVLEALSKYRQELKENDEAPEVYVRPDKEQELDVLWQNFKSNQKFEKSPGIYLGAGFIGGVITTLLVSFVAGVFSTSPKVPSDEALVTQQEINSEIVVPSEQKKSLFSRSDKKDVAANSDNAEPEIAPVENKLYQIKSGDTMSSILMHFYGNISKENEEKVLKANGMTDPNKLTAGDKITIPVEVNTNNR